MAAGRRLPAMPLGTELRCTTVHGNTVEGYVAATDDRLKALVIHETADKTGDVHIINLAHITDVQIVSPPDKCMDTAHRAVNIQRVSDRMKAAIDTRRKKIDRIGVNVTAQAQDLYDCIAKTYNEIRWDGEVIVVLNDVKIAPPYQPENCIGSQPCTERLQKIVAKYHRD